MVHFQSCLCGYGSPVSLVSTFRGHKPFWRENLFLERGQIPPWPPPCWFDDLASQKVVHMVDSLKLVYLGKGFRREIESLLSMTLLKQGQGDKETSCCQVMTLPGPTWEEPGRHLIWRGLAQLVDCLPSRERALSSLPLKAKEEESWLTWTVFHFLVQCFGLFKLLRSFNIY